METLGIITNDQSGVFQRQVIAGVCDLAETAGYQVVIDSLIENPEHEVTMTPEQVDGILIIANPVPLRFLEALHQAGKPLALVSEYHTNLPIPAVVFNNAQGIRALVKHLVEDCRRRHLLFVRGIPTQYDAIQREQAFQQEIMRYNLPAMRLLPGEFDPDLAAASIRTVLEQGAQFDAVIAADYLMAEAVVTTLQQAGISVPGQISVVGFGDAPEAEQAGLTTVAANVRELGQRSARQLIHQMKGLSIRGVTTLSVELVIRATSDPQKLD